MKYLISTVETYRIDTEAEVEQMIAAWDSLEGKISDDTFNLVKGRFGRQLYNAKEWRDQVNSYFFRKSGIADEKGRAIY